MLREALLQIGGDAHIALSLDRFALQQIYISIGLPFFAKASKGILLRDLMPGKSCEARSAKQDGGGGRTRTCEVIRRLIYSQLPLPLGTLPRCTNRKQTKRKPVAELT